MADVDRLGWVNQVMAETAKVLRNSVKFMHVSALANGQGQVVEVSEHGLDEELMLQNGKVYCSLVWDGNEPVDQMTAEVTDHRMDIRVALEAKAPKGCRPAERQALWRTIARAQSVLNWVLLREIAHNGGKFNGVVPFIKLGRTNAMERTAEDGSYVAVAETKVGLDVSLQDYDNT